MTLEGLQGFSSLSWSVGVRGLEEQYFIFSREMRGGEARANILTCFSTPDSLDKLTGTERGDGSQERDTLQIENGSKLVERYLGLISPNIVTGLI